MTVGAWTLTYVRGERQSGVTCIGLLIPPAPRSISFSRPSRTQQRLSAFCSKRSHGANHPVPQVINTDGHAAYPPAVARLKSRRRSRRGLPASAGAIFEQRARAGSPRHKAAGQREPRLPVLGLLHRFILGLFAAT